MSPRNPTILPAVRSGGASFDPRERIGARICVAARKFQLLTRPILDTIVFMPPLCVSNAEIDLAIEAIERGMEEVCGRWEVGVVE